MIKQGIMPTEDQAINAWSAWRLALEGTNYPQGKFTDQPGTVQLAWANSCQQLERLFRDEVLFDRKWEQIASMFYERLRGSGGLDHCANTFDDAPLEIKLAIETAVRHLVNCYLAENGERLESVLLTLIREWLPKAEAKVNHQPVTLGE